MEKIQNLPAYAMVFVIAGVLLMVGTYIVAQVGTQVSGVDTIAGNISSGLGNLAQWLPIIGVVVAAVILMGMVLRIGRG